MKIPRSQIAPVLAKLSLQPGVNAEQLGREVAAYLLDENRTGELDSLARDLVAYRADNEAIVEVTAISAHRLSPEVLGDIDRQVRAEYPDAKEVIINERIDAQQIGGVRLELVGRQLDLTVRNKLNQFKALTAVER